MSDFWALVVTTGIFTATVNLVLSNTVDGIKHWWASKRLNTYSAMRCAVVLDQYATDCWSIYVMGQGEFERHRDMTSQHLPGAPSFPDDIDWKAMNPGLVDEILSFANPSSIAQTLADYARLWEHNPYDFHSAAKERGLEALKLSARIRKVSGLQPTRGMDRVWSDFTK